MTKKINFELPISNNRFWQGKLDVYANIDGSRHDYHVEFSNIIHEDRSGRRSNVTALIENLCPDLMDKLEEIASGYVVDEDKSDYTLEMQ